jgi:hypothetical protein
LITEGAGAQIHAGAGDVAKFVSLGPGGLETLGEELERQREMGNVDIEQAAYLAEDGALIVVGQGSRGAFAFRVPAGGWGWCRPLA